ncbi:MAG: AsnC family transcriptional regulator [Candidatus Micrarchaeota archaeon]|nr:AsnC family transcriptional regulator [Candidatus Micrarchaeota archaeon]
MRSAAIQQLDLRDRRLLYLLDLDGRMSYSKIAKQLRTSKQVVKYRVERLEHEGYIKGYHTIIDLYKLGYIPFRVYFKLRNLYPKRKKEIVSYLKSQKNVWAVSLAAGRWDLAIAIAVKDIHEFYLIWEEILRNYLPNISDYQTSIYAPIYHFSRSYLIESEDTSKIRMLGGRGMAEVDEKDLKILVELSKNARASLLDISEKVGITPEAISHRIAQLAEKEVIQGYRALIDTAKMGYEFYEAQIRLSSYKDVKIMLEFCHSHQNITQVNKTIGGETLEVHFQVKSLGQMLSIMEEFEKMFPKSIEKFDYITVISQEKRTYMPELE